MRFVVAKTRVAPLQSQTIPRLELLSALLLSRLVTSVSDSLQYTLSPMEQRCFTNSQVALYWICGIGKEWKPFVRNRVAEIRRQVPPNCWSHCPGKTNPADLPSRGLPLLELSVNRLWRSGPEWIKAGMSLIEESGSVNMPDECATKMRTKSQSTHSLLAPNCKPAMGEIIDCKDYNTMSRLLGVTAYVLRAVKRFRKSLTASSPSTTLTAKELLEQYTLTSLQICPPKHSSDA